MTFPFWRASRRRVSLPNIKWGLLYGVILCNGRAMGEFEAVSVVSGQIRDETNTIPLHVEILYNEHACQASFAVASMLARVTLVLKSLVEWRSSRQGAQAGLPAEYPGPAASAVPGPGAAAVRPQTVAA
uniref:hypothetical protein n=1 Tax=Pigmentiphaga litoralis TaxID=516702 RepID=UPI003570B7BD